MIYKLLRDMDLISLMIFGVLAAILTAAAVIDVRTMQVPDAVPISILVLAAISLLTGNGPAPASRVCGSLAVGGAMLLVSILTKGGIGGGDIKLMAASGLLLGFPRNLLAFILAYIAAGLLFAIPMLLGKLDRNRQVPMVPYLAAAILVSFLFGDRIIGWYLRCSIL